MRCAVPKSCQWEVFPLTIVKRNRPGSCGSALTRAEQEWERAEQGWLKWEEQQRWAEDNNECQE